MFNVLVLIMAWLLTAPAAHALDLKEATTLCRAATNTATEWECLAYVQDTPALCTKAYNDTFCKKAMVAVRAKEYSRCEYLSQYATNSDDKKEMERWCTALTRRSTVKCVDVVPKDMEAKRDCELTVKALLAMDAALLAEANGGGQQVATVSPSTPPPVVAPDEQDEQEEADIKTPIYEDIASETVPWRREVRTAAKKLHDLTAGLIKPMKDADRSKYTDMALGFTSTREQQIPDDLDRELRDAINLAKTNGDADLVKELRALISEANDKDNTNLRLFGDTLQASSWMDWADVDDEVAADYSLWFETSAVQALKTTGGRFKFNLTGYEKSVMAELKELAATVPMELLNRAVNLPGGTRDFGGVEIRKLAKTEWEVIRILTDKTLFDATEWYVFDKLKDDAPVKLTGAELASWSVNEAVASPDYAQWLTAHGASDPLPEVKARMLTETTAPDFGDPALAAWERAVTKASRAYVGDANGLWDQTDGTRVVQNWRRAHPPVVAASAGPAFNPNDKKTWLEEAKREALIRRADIDWSGGKGKALLMALEDYVEFTDDWNLYRDQYVDEAIKSIKW